MPPTVSIIIITHNQLPYTQQCLQSLRQNTPIPHEIVLIDNGSTDQTPAFLQSQPDLTLILNPQNRGFPAAANQGLRAASAPYILLLNNDVLLPPGWLERLLQPLLDHPDLGLVGPLTSRISGQQEIPISYTDPLTDLAPFAEDLARRNAGKLQYVDRLVGFCLLFRREVLTRVGLLDERFGIGNFEDDDFCRRAALAGFRAAIVQDAFIHHFGSVSFQSAALDLDALLRRNQQLYAEKWFEPPRSPAQIPSSLPLPEIPDNPRLSLCMIVRDAARTLTPCLESIRPFVDEMIVVDTGSRDHTPALAQAAGAKVFHFPWCDSFAAARNESLRHATGDWLVWMDADDTINPENGRKLRELAQRKTAALGYILQVHCPSDSNDPYATPTRVDHVKLFRNHPEIRFTGRIHEQILPAIRKLGGGGGVEWTDLFITHSGSDQSPAGRARKQDRDLRLLNLELADDPDNSFTLFNLGMTLLDAAKPADALPILARSLQLASPAESHCRKIYALLVQAYSDLGRHQTALKTTLQGLAHFPEDLELLFRKSRLEFLLNQLPQAEQSLLQLLSLSNSPESGPRRYFASFDQGILGIRAWQTLALLYEKQTRYDRAAEAWQKVLTFNPQNLPAWRSLIDLLARAQDLHALERISADRTTPPEASLIAQARLLTARGQSPTAITLFEDAVQKSPSTDLLDELCRLLFTSDQLPLAERWLTEMTRRRPDDPAAHLNLAIIFLRSQNLPAAAQHARRSLELRPNHPTAQEVLAKSTPSSTPH